MANIDRLNDSVVEDLMEALIENGAESEQDAKDAINAMSTQKTLQIYLEWNGIFGYTEDIMNIVRNSRIE